MYRFNRVHGKRCVVCIIKELEGELSAACSSPMATPRSITVIQRAIKIWEAKIRQYDKIPKGFKICSPSHNEYALSLIKERKRDYSFMIERLKYKINSAEELVSKQVSKALDYALTFGIDAPETDIERARIRQYEQLLYCRRMTLNRIYKRIGKKEIA